ncbi:hypothetical protein VmeM32_00205 [Vibrio phage vB_VmeM-32]|nr:hypothetical protein VmeM32_00205 [Vibrio phage vB_VmeM-32]
MFVLENHFDNNPTILIHNLVINGNQTHVIDDINTIPRGFDVTPRQWAKIKKVFTGDKSTDNQIMKFVDHADWQVRKAIAQYGSDIHRDILVHDIFWLVRGRVAEHGNNSHRDILIRDSHFNVRCLVAQYGTKAHRDFLANDVDDDVRDFVENMK